VLFGGFVFASLVALLVGHVSFPRLWCVSRVVLTSATHTRYTLCRHVGTPPGTKNTPSCVVRSTKSTCVTVYGFRVLFQRHNNGTRDTSFFGGWGCDASNHPQKTGATVERVGRSVSGVLGVLGQVFTLCGGTSETVFRCGHTRFLWLGRAKTQTLGGCVCAGQQNRSRNTTTTPTTQTHTHPPNRWVLGRVVRRVLNGTARVANGVPFTRKTQGYTWWTGKHVFSCNGRKTETWGLCRVGALRASHGTWWRVGARVGTYTWCTTCVVVTQGCNLVYGVGGVWVVNGNGCGVVGWFGTRFAGCPSYGKTLGGPLHGREQRHRG
jgi:hypothetical protein